MFYTFIYLHLLSYTSLQMVETLPLQEDDYLVDCLNGLDKQSKILQALFTRGMFSSFHIV